MEDGGGRDPLESIRVRVLGKGAEAILYLEIWRGRLVIRKVRVPKRYRNPKLDIILRRWRTSLEAKLLYEAKRLGVPVPCIFDVDLDATTIVMEYIQGMRLRDVLSNLDSDVIRRYFEQIGESVGILHKHGIVHGDLTTSNMIITRSGNVYLIDFGLGAFSHKLEDQGTDLHLMLRALESTHGALAQFCFKFFIRGYRKVMGSRTNEVLRKVKEIRSRGRYVAVEERRR